jgi:hypothetical protein
VDNCTSAIDQADFDMLAGNVSTHLSARRAVMFERMEDLTGKKDQSKKEQIVECSLICVGIVIVLGIMILALLIL